VRHAAELCGHRHNSGRKFFMPAILLWLLGVPIPVIILLILLFHG